MGGWLSAQTWELLRNGLWLTVGLTAVTTLLSLVAGVLAGTMRLSARRSWRLLGATHVEVHRNVPALVLIIFWAFAIPNLLPPEARRLLFFDNGVLAWLATWTGIAVPYYLLAAVLGLTLNTSAYVAELFRAGVGAIPHQHLDAARTLGATQRSVYWRIVLPEGMRIAFPAVSTRLIHNLKNTALASFVAVPELFQTTLGIITRSFRALELLALASLLYLVLALALATLLRATESLITRRPPRTGDGVAALAGERHE